MRLYIDNHFLSQSLLLCKLPFLKSFQITNTWKVILHLIIIIILLIMSFMLLREMSGEPQWRVSFNGLLQKLKSFVELRGSPLLWRTFLHSRWKVHKWNPPMRIEMVIKISRYFLKSWHYIFTSRSARTLLLNSARWLIYERAMRRGDGGGCLLFFSLSLSLSLFLHIIMHSHFGRL